jgi:hypothetical protein
MGQFSIDKYMERLVPKHQGVLAILTGISGHFGMEQSVSLNWNTRPLSIGIAGHFHWNLHFTR